MGAPPDDLPGLARLSPREEQVLGLASEGLLDKQIAANLGITENTMRTYWRRIRLKVGELSRSALAVQYARSKAVDGIGFMDGAEWWIELDRDVVCYLSERDHLPQGETPLAEAMEIFHPDDRERVRDVFHALKERELPLITLVARVVTPHGVETTSSSLWAVRDGSGKVVRIEGRPIPIIDLTREADGVSLLGSYRRNLETGAVTVDEGFCDIYRVRADAPDLRAAVLSRYCPEHREKMRGLVDGMIAAGRHRRRFTSRLCFEDGGSLWVTSQSRLDEQGGRPSAFVATVVSYH